MRKKNGFTLIEMIAVIIILGIIMVITVPAVQKYILNSNRASYAADIQAFIENIKAEYEMNDYGQLVKEDEVMIVPIEHIEFEKGQSEESPFGAYDMSRSYIMIIPERNGYQFYANIVDANGIGVSMQTSSEISQDTIQENLSPVVKTWKSYTSASNIFSYQGKNYSMCEIRDIETLEKTVEDAIIILCQK